MTVGKANSSSPKEEKTFLATIDNLHEMLKFISAQARQRTFNDGSLDRIQLACEEALVNIINYGYSRATGTISIICQDTETPGIQITLCDRGIPFNPLKDTRQAQEGKVGGYGVFLIVELMDQVVYRRELEQNILTLIKYL